MPSLRRQSIRADWPGYYHCTRIYLTQVIHHITQQPIVQQQFRCNGYVQEGTEVNESRILCVCKELYADRQCEDCGRWMCPLHRKIQAHVATCGNCLLRINSNTAYYIYQPHYRMPEVIASSKHPIERAIRWLLFRAMSEQLSTGFDLDAMFRSLFPEDAKAGRTEPLWDTAEVVTWFLEWAAAKEYGPTTNYERVITKKHWYFGNSFARGKAVHAWHFSGGARNPNPPHLMIDVYILPDGRAVLASSIHTGEPPAELNTHALRKMAILLDDVVQRWWLPLR